MAQLAEKVFKENGTKHRMMVEGGLHMIKGNSAPYFTITADVERLAANGWVEDSGGCLHDLIREHFGDRFDDLIALHLCAIDGVPMHAVANGWYWLARAVKGHYRERYHGGNAKGQWEGGAGGEYRVPTREECLETLAKHLRISHEEAAQLAATIIVEPIDEHLFVGMTVEQIHEMEAEAKKEAKDKFAAFVDAQRPRYKQEAQACIERHGLEVFTD